MESLEYKGLWWLPESSGNTFSGVLTFHPVAGSILEIEEGLNFNALNRAPIELIEQFPGGRFLRLVVGKSDKPITLAGLTWLGQSQDSSRRHFYRVDMVYKNAAFARESDLVFDRVDVVCDRLKMNDSRFSDLETKSGSHPHTTFFLPGFEAISYISIPDPGGGAAQKSLFRFRLKDLLSYAAFEQAVLQPWLNFWTLIIGEPVVPLALYGNNRLFDGLKSPDRLVEIHRAFSRLDDHRHWIERKHLWYFVLDYKTIADHIQQALETWYAMHRQIRSVFDLYFDAFEDVGSGSLHTQNLFLTYCRVIEGYHRVFHGGEFFEDETYQRLYTAMTKTLTETLPGNDYQEQREHLQAMLRMGQVYPLEKRLEDLINRLLGPYKETVHYYVARDLQAFKSSVQTMRKELLQQTETTKSASEIKYLARALNIIIRLCFADQMGFSPETAIGIAMR